MGLLAHYRRFWFVIVALILTMPLAVQLLTPRQTVSQREARSLKPAPALPHSAAQWMKLPREIDVFLGDHFGLRDSLVRANAVLRHALLSTTNNGVLYGRDGRLFFNGDAMLEQSLGIAQRNAEVARFTDFAAGLSKQYRARGVRFLVAVPPNATTIERQFVPGWFIPAPPTE
ncbi:MAG: hypothetical protein JO254_04005, partial [Pseudolabrys sp.]|nr:hypothetical protein [Pseudolabrys sp.]